MHAIRDMYDLLPPDRAAELRRHNKERLAELEARAPSAASGSPRSSATPRRRALRVAASAR